MASNGKGIADGYPWGKRSRNGDDNAGYRKRKILNGHTLFKDSGSEIGRNSSSADGDSRVEYVEAGRKLDDVEYAGRGSYVANPYWPEHHPSFPVPETGRSFGMAVPDSGGHKEGREVRRNTTPPFPYWSKHRSSHAVVVPTAAPAPSTHINDDLKARAEPKTHSIPRCPKTEYRYDEEEEQHYEQFGSKYSGVSVGSWARVKRGKYMGDLAQVVHVNEKQRKVTVKLLPRLDLQAVAIKNSGGDTVYTSPAPRLITSSELDAYRTRVRSSLDHDTGDLYEVFDGMKLKDGYVFKKLALDSLVFLTCEPSEEELTKFMPQNKQESNEDSYKKQTVNNDKRGDGSEGLSEANFIEKLRSRAHEFAMLMEEAATRCLGKASVEDQLREALVELQSCKERVSAVEAERDSLRDSLKQEREKMDSVYKRILDTKFEIVTCLKEDLGIWCARHEGDI